MVERISIKADAKTNRVISELHGAAIILGNLKDEDGPKSTLPGFALALAIVEREVAGMRAQMASAVYRCAAKAGHNIANITSIYTNIGKDGCPVIELESGDLVNQAENP